MFLSNFDQVMINLSLSTWLDIKFDFSLILSHGKLPIKYHPMHKLTNVTHKYWRHIREKKKRKVIQFLCLYNLSLQLDGLTGIVQNAMEPISWCLLVTIDLIIQTLELVSVLQPRPSIWKVHKQMPIYLLQRINFHLLFPRIKRILTAKYEKK